MIVNGHVPVKVEKGESPLKRSGKAVTIDGAFSEAYGDHGFTLVLEPLRTYIATHHHFESVEAAIERGDDIVPTRTVVREWEEPRRVADSQRGRVLGFAMERLERLIEAYWWPTIVFTIGITGLALPPLTGIDAPLRNEALSEATNRIASAISSGRPRRLSGAPEAMAPIGCSEPANRCSISVSIGPGAATFTRTANGAASRPAVSEAKRIGSGCIGVGHVAMTV